MDSAADFKCDGYWFKSLLRGAQPAAALLNAALSNKFCSCVHIFKVDLLHKSSLSLHK